MSDELARAAARARVEQDNKACEQAWQEIYASIPKDAMQVANADMLKLMKSMFEMGWDKGIIYMAENPLI